MLKPFFTDLLNRIKEDNLSKGIDNWLGAARSMLVLHIPNGCLDAYEVKLDIDIF